MERPGRDIEIAVLGYVTADIVTRLPSPLTSSADAVHANIELRPGGSGTNVAGWLGALGEPTTLHAMIGDDVIGHALEAIVLKENISVRLSRSGSTTTIISLVHPDGSRTLLVDNGGPFDKTSLTLPNSHRGWLHIPAFMIYRDDLRPLTMLAMQECSHECPLSIDINSAAFLSNFGPAQMIQLLTDFRPTILAMNESEAAQFYRIDELSACARYTIIHRGSRATQLWVDGVAFETSNGIDADTPVVDSTGAGDALLAGFISAILRGDSAIEALTLGHKVAQVAIGQIGGFPSSAETKQNLEKLKASRAGQ